jgi:hypothetical protein
MQPFLVPKTLTDKAGGRVPFGAGIVKLLSNTILRERSRFPPGARAAVTGSPATGHPAATVFPDRSVHRLCRGGWQFPCPGSKRSPAPSRRQRHRLEQPEQHLPVLCRLRELPEDNQRDYGQAYIFTSSSWAHLTASSAGMPCTALAYMSTMMYLVTASAAARLGGPA